MVSALEEEVRRIVNKHDPIGLLKIGCPSDEYDPEIRKIMPLLMKATSREEFHDVVYHIFVQMFDKKTAGQRKKYGKLSKDIYELRNSERP